MIMHNPPPAGEYIREMFLEPRKLSPDAVALRLGVEPVLFKALLDGEQGITADLALRLSKVLGQSPESWMALQAMRELWLAREASDLSGLKRIPDVETESVK